MIKAWQRRCDVFVGAIMAVQLSLWHPCLHAIAAGSGQITLTHANELNKGPCGGKQAVVIQEEGSGQATLCKTSPRQSNRRGKLKSSSPAFIAHWVADNLIRHVGHGQVDRRPCPPVCCSKIWQRVAPSPVISQSDQSGSQYLPSFSIARARRQERDKFRQDRYWLFTRCACASPE